MVTRRGALGWITGGILSAIGAVLGVLGGGAVLGRPSDPAAGAWTDAGALRDLRRGTPLRTALRIERRDGYLTTYDQRIVYLVRDRAGVRALSARCTHLGCSVLWDEEQRQFRCPCHGGRFTLEGQVAGGPPPAPLRELPVRVVQGRVSVQA